MNGNELTHDLKQLNDEVTRNRLFCKIFILSTLAITVALFIVLDKGIKLLNEKVALSPQHRVSEVFVATKDLRKSIELQLDSIPSPEAATPEAIKANFETQKATMVEEEQDFQIFINNYKAILAGISDNVGNVDEWHHFSQLRLNQLIKNSKYRGQQLQAATSP